MSDGNPMDYFKERATFQVATKGESRDELERKARKAAAQYFGHDRVIIRSARVRILTVDPEGTTYEGDFVLAEHVPLLGKEDPRV